jgi:hypothetical protein
LGYLMRCADYRLLRIREEQTVLAQPPHAVFIQPDTGLRREAWQVLEVDWISTKDPSHQVKTRLVVTRRPAFGNGKPRVGKREGNWVYELFVTDRSPSAWSITDVLSLYFARGGFENTLSQEDRECKLDRTVSFSPAGQEAWVLAGQLVWNFRLRLGLLFCGAKLRLHVCWRCLLRPQSWRCRPRLPCWRCPLP